MRNDKEPNPIVEKSFQLALTIIKYSEQLEIQRRYIIAKQLLKSGTSIGANIREAQNAESKLDFIHKIKIAAKEADETEYWLLLCKESQYPDTNLALDQVREIIKILSKIISTSKRNAKSFSN
jgi:four helix bundle protein